MQTNTPADFNQPTGSFRKTRASIMAIIGDDVVPINARLIAVV